MSELKPCPFCEEVTLVGHGQKDGYISVWCKCGCSGPSYPVSDKDFNSIIKARDKAIDTWNTRATTPTAEPFGFAYKHPSEPEWRWSKNDPAFPAYSHYVVKPLFTTPTAVDIANAPEFKPSVFHHEEGDFTQMLLEDCATVTGYPGVVVEPLYRMVDRSLVGFQWHGKVPSPVTTPTASELVEAGAKAAYEHWQNIPACIASKSWEDRCENLPASAEFFRNLSRKVLAARPALSHIGEE